MAAMAAFAKSLAAGGWGATAHIRTRHQTFCLAHSRCGSDFCGRSNSCMVFAGQTAFAAALGQAAEIFRPGSNGIVAFNDAAGIGLGART